MLPDRLAVEVVAEEARGAEEGVHQDPVSGTRGRGVAVPGMRLARRDTARRQPLPQEFAVAGLYTQDVPFIPPGLGGSQEDPVAPDDWRRIALAGQRRLPEQVVLIAPGERYLGILGVALAAGAAP